MQACADCHLGDLEGVSNDKQAEKKSSWLQSPRVHSLGKPKTAPEVQGEKASGFREASFLALCGVRLLARSNTQEASRRKKLMPTKFALCIKSVALVAWPEVDPIAAFTIGIDQNRNPLHRLSFKTDPTRVASNRGLANAHPSVLGAFPTQTSSCSFVECRVQMALGCGTNDYLTQDGRDHFGCQS